MLEYESSWGNPSHMISTDPVSETSSDHHSQEINMFNNSHHHSTAAANLSLDHYAHHGFTQSSPNLTTTQTTFSRNQFLQHQAEQAAMYDDPRAFPITTSYHAHHHHQHHQMDSLTGLNNSSNMPAAGGAGGGGYFLVTKTEEGTVVGPQGTRIGLNLGHRTYFSAQDDDFVNRLYRRSRNGGMLDGCGVNTPRCQAEGCAVDLSNAKHYHRRHKVCEFHSKASTVIAGGLTQRFCQQCSRFHLLTEFDNGKRSCRKRLADHNRRRRKTPQHPAPQSQLELQKSPVENSSSDNNLAKSPPESSAITTHPSSSSASVTVAVSARMALDCFRQKSYKEMASSSSSGSVFYSN